MYKRQPSGYVAVSGRGCESYIHMDDGWYGDRWLSGGSTSLEDCAAAVRAYDGQNGCRGAYFFWEYEGYCNCPRDDCELGSENQNAGGSGQLYRSGCGDSGSASGSFVYVDQAKSFDDARAYCRAHYHDLASIQSSSENAAVAALCPGQCWIGGSDAAQEGTWTWSDGTAWDYDNWESCFFNYSGCCYFFIII